MTHRLTKSPASDGALPSFGPDPVVAASADPRVPAGVVRDMVNLPHHYARWPYEPIRFLVENGVDGLRYNAVKYIMRCDAKNGWEDIRKAIRSMEMFGKWKLDRDPDWWKAESPEERLRREARAMGFDLVRKEPDGNQ